MNRFLCEIISPTGESIEIPYYELENTCKMLVTSYINDFKCSHRELLERKKKFLLFRRRYKTFAPYFDYLFIELKYILKNPFLVPDSILTKTIEDGVSCYYAKYTKDISKLNRMSQHSLSQPLFIQGLEDNILKEKIKEPYDDLQECFINENLEMLTLKGPLDLHNFWAKMWLHSLMMRDALVCADYIEQLQMDDDLIYYDSAGFLQRYYHWIRFAKTTIGSKSGTTYYATYYQNQLSKMQQDFLETLELKKLLLPCYSIKLD